ncbi:Hypothetical predicted protein [Lecanosticta acicola]|uniref:PD-(D/E)XK nuclease-like domain-containing protein n=1 Tax=Lecanosticta acicola TaxID=111012 RepID=A0AAI8YYJ5_9PEZI|nr:Hypothetical predicted protein [Lecanosticta acicola]
MWSDATIDIWLQQIPTTALAQSRKRALAEMSANAATPRVKRTKTSQSGDIAINEDAEEAYELPTPRARHPLATAPPLRPPSSKPSTESGASSQAQSASGVSAGSRRKRTPSPPKMLALRQLDDYPVYTRALPPFNQLPELIRELAIDMRRIESGRGVISEGFEGWKQQLGSGIGEEDERILDRSGERQRLGRDMSLEEVEFLQERAIWSQDNNAAEPSWNCFVHSRALEWAQRLSPYRATTFCEDITTAGVFWAESEDTQRSSKRADFCLALRMDRRIQKLLRDIGVPQVNHTSYSPLMFNPIAVSIETKAARGNESEAVLQLQTWATAQIMFLRSMLSKTGHEGTPLPPLPLVIVQSHEWKVYYFVDRGDQAVIYHDSSPFGTTETILGIYKLHAGLQRLIMWSEEQYRTWIMDNVINPRLHASQAGPSEI